jgi:hypothetical protein
MMFYIMLTISHGTVTYAVVWGKNPEDNYKVRTHLGDSQSNLCSKKCSDFSHCSESNKE